MKSKNKLSQIIVYLIVCVFAYAYFQTGEIEKSKQECLAAYDQFGYYSYLPATFIYGDLAFQKPWKDSLESKYCDQKVNYQFVETEEGKIVNMYHMGLAYIHLPGFVIANNLAEPLGYKKDGMSLPYRLAVRFTALLFVFLGLFFLRKVLLLFFNDITTSLTLLFLFGASNIFLTFLYGDLMPHMYLFALNTIALYYLILYWKDRKWKYIIICALVFGLTTAIRPTQALWGLIPFGLLFFENKNYWKSLQLLLIFPLAALLFNVPQLLYWKIEGGHWLMLNLHSESLAITNPNLVNFLFSYKKGWLVYSPLFFFSFIGIWQAYRTNKVLTRTLVLFLIVIIYVLSSWDCWWYAGSYGCRVLVDSYGILALFLAFFVDWMHKKNRFIQIAISLILIAFISLNCIQSIQYHRGIMPMERMTKDHYWYIFGKLNLPNFDESLMEINRQDLNWDSKILKNNSNAFRKGYTIKSKTIFCSNKTLVFDEADEFSNITVLIPWILFKTDEVKLSVSFDTDDTNRASEAIVTFALEGTSHYFFHKCRIRNDATDRIFNLPVILHKNDHLKVYIYNPNREKGSIRNLKIQAHYLDRNE